ncbi:MAG: hypothetical protein KDE47_06615, partial [Caldilineaceae bacterium]|nr:hypothetical protein [Caldilineaceae bacterium]
RAIGLRPFLVVRDEPNFNLDAEGELALACVIQKLRSLGSIAVVIAHRPSVLKAVDQVGVMQGGKLIAFGPKDSILEKHTRQPRPAAVVAHAKGRTLNPAPMQVAGE